MSLKNIISRRNRILLRELVVTDFKLRYQGSFLGYLWSLLKPLFLFAILYTVFGLVLRLGAEIDHFPVYLLLGIVLWGFFSEATMQGLQAIVARGDLIRKINFPKYIIIIASTTSSLINLAFNLVVVGFFLWLNGVEVSSYAIIFFPLLILEMYIFALALAFFLSAFYVKFRDVNYLWEIVLQGAFYATPILYPIQFVFTQSEFAAKLLLMNPMAQIIQDSRALLVTPQTITAYETFESTLYQIMPFIIIAVIAIVGVVYFKFSQKYFAEHI